MSEKKDKKNEVIKISEKEIQRKLYGMEQKKDNSARAASEEKPAEKEIQNKIYVKTPKESSQNIAAPGKDLFEEKKNIDIEIQEEINALKQSIVNLEDKLKKTENQKERLKIRLVQNRKIAHFKEGMAVFIFNKMADKIIIAIVLLIIAAVLVTVMKFRPKAKEDTPAQAKTPGTLQKKVIPKETKKTLAPVQVIQNNKKEEISAKEKRYTIQVAEYADEDAAKQFVQKLESRGFTVFTNIIYRGSDRDKPYFKINVGSFATYEEAKRFNEDLKAKINISDSFIKENSK